MGGEKNKPGTVYILAEAKPLGYAEPDRFTRDSALWRQYAARRASDQLGYDAIWLSRAKRFSKEPAATIDAKQKAWDAKVNEFLNDDALFQQARREANRTVDVPVDQTFISEANRLKSRLKSGQNVEVVPFYNNEDIVRETYRKVKPGDSISILGHASDRLGGIPVVDLGAWADQEIKDKTGVECYLGSCGSAGYMAQDFAKQSTLTTYGYQPSWYGPNGPGESMYSLMYGYAMQGTEGINHKAIYQDPALFSKKWHYPKTVDKIAPIPADTIKLEEKEQGLSTINPVQSFANGGVIKAGSFDEHLYGKYPEVYFMNPLEKDYDEKFEKIYDEWNQSMNS